MKTSSLLFVIIILLNFQLYSQDTLRHIKAGFPLKAYIDTNAGKMCGYITGMSCSFNEAFGERYDISDSAVVLGIISYHKGNFKDFTKKVEFKIYSVGESGMPDSNLATRVQTYRNLIVYGNPVVTKYYEPVKVGKSFYVVIDFLDYPHYPLTDSIAVLSSIHNDNSDRDFGRNVLRVHHYGYQDLYSKTGLNINLALFPIIKFPAVISGNLENSVSTSHLKLSAPFPNPCIDEINIPYEIITSGKVSYQILSESGTLQSEKDLGLVTPGLYSEKIDLSNYPNGTYIILLNAGQTTLGVSIIK